MANTGIKDARDTWGIRFAHTIDHDGPASYTTGGETIPASVFGFKFIAAVIAHGSDNSAHVCVPVFTGKGAKTSFKLMWILTGGLEVANAVNLSARFVRLTVYGR